MATWLMTSSTVFLFLLKTKVMWNLACPPILTHWSMKTSMSFPVTVKIDFVKVEVFQIMLFHARGSALTSRALLARDRSLFKTWNNR